MTLTDTGPLVGLIDADDQHHASRSAAYPGLTTPLLTTWPCFSVSLHITYSTKHYLISVIFGASRFMVVQIVSEQIEQWHRPL